MINISRQFYAAWNSAKRGDPLHEVELVPGGDTPGEKKRLASLTAKNTDIVEYENVPLPGFTLLKTNRKRWGSIDATWLVIDPRGFLSRITSDNLEAILSVTGITEGLIQEKCVWVRENSQSQMVLVPVTSESYKEAVANTILIEEKISMKDVEIGDRVLLQNKLQGIYMGTLSLYGPLFNINYKNKRHEAQKSLRRQIVMVDNDRFYYQTDVKILKILQKAVMPMTKIESVAKLNESILSGKAYFSGTDDILLNNYYTTYGMITHVSTIAVTEVPLVFEEIQRDEFEQLFNKSLLNNTFGYLAAETEDGSKMYIQEATHKLSHQRVTSLTLFTSTTIASIAKNYFELKEYNRTADNHQTSLDIFTKFYKIVKYVKKESYI